MFKKDSCSVEFFESHKKIFLYKDSVYDEDHEIEGDVYFNHDRNEIKIYNFPKVNLTSEEKDKIMASILKSVYLFPNYLKSKESQYKDISQYTLLINAYLLDGTYKIAGNKYKTIIEEFIENTDYFDESDEIHKIKNKIFYFYNKYESKLAKESVVIYLNNNHLFKGYIEYKNFIRLFVAYLKSKGKRVRLIARNEFWTKEKSIEILPY